MNRDVVIGLSRKALMEGWREARREGGLPEGVTVLEDKFMWIVDTPFKSRTTVAWESQFLFRKTTLRVMVYHETADGSFDCSIKGDFADWSKRFAGVDATCVWKEILSGLSDALADVKRGMMERRSLKKERAKEAADALPAGLADSFVIDCRYGTDSVSYRTKASTGIGLNTWRVKDCDSAVLVKLTEGMIVPKTALPLLLEVVKMAALRNVMAKE